ncbi:GNAT family N-acetyltransferase [Micromonospora sp. DT229]|uniref:GNAT family N-acetyltransferase n=1 Tax=Micromonospora sp. DT229 TaxID=3393430 RepID=UPI003CF3D106
MFTMPLTADAELRPLNPWHAEEFLANLDRARESMTPWVSPAFVATDLPQARHVLQRYADRWARDDGGIWGIWSNGKLVGGVLLVSLNAETGVCEAGCWLEPAAVGGGLVTRAVSRLIDWAIDERGLHRVEWRVVTGNVRSIAVARRLGMRCDGVLREVAPGPDGRLDLEIWSLLAPEWRARRAGASGD